MEKHLKNYIVSSKIEALKKTVQFYQEQPFYYFENDMFSKRERIQMATEKLNNFMEDFKQYRKDGNFDRLEIPTFEKAIFIRNYAIEEREKARDFNTNPFIVIPSLKNSIKAIRILLEIYPQLKVYSNHWLASRNVIAINDNF